MKTCTCCKQEKADSEYWNNREASDGLQSRCKECSRRVRREWGKTDDGKAYQREYRRKNRDKINARKRENPWHRTEKGKVSNRKAYLKVQREQPEKYKARYNLNNAVMLGKIERPTVCEKCGTSGMIQGHHHKGYAEEYWLDVEWLCASCHGQENVTCLGE